jgi:hypothetical protein
MARHAQSQRGAQRLSVLGGANRKEDGAGDRNRDRDQDDRDPEATAPGLIRERRRLLDALIISLSRRHTKPQGIP